MLTRRETAIDRVFPYREPRTRRAPDVDDIGMRTRLAIDPFKQIENQWVEIVLQHRIPFQIGVNVTRKPSFGFGIGHICQSGL